MRRAKSVLESVPSSAVPEAGHGGAFVAKSASMKPSRIPSISP
jgi:hypothetical protein